MVNLSNECPNFEVDEKDLIDFEEYCDLKYKDPLVQKFGFFKVHLSKDVRRQTSSEDFLANFNLDAQRTLKEFIVLQNPVDCGLYGHIHMDATSVFKTQFMQGATSNSFQVTKSQPNCCMECLEQNGLDAFLEHFYSEVSFMAMPSKYRQLRNIKGITSKTPTWRAAYEKRQQFQKQCSVKGKSRVLELSMQSEKFNECFKMNECSCDTCAYMNLEISPHRDAPIGFLYSFGIEESSEKYLKLTENFAMAYLCYKNMLSMLDSTYGRVSFPSLYVGQSHSVIPIHVEELSLWSFTFLLFGYPKFWVVVPPYAVGKLTEALTRCGFGSFNRTCRNLLGHKFYIPNVSWLISEAIPFNVVIQREGEGVVFLPNASKTGGNMGPNVVESCRFGSKSWIPYGCVYPLCFCMDNPLHVDLTPIVAVHDKGLLKAYISNQILSAAEDVYFLKSVLSRTSGSSEDLATAFCSSSRKDKLRFKCPVCPHTWGSSIPKRNIMNHLTKYHASQLKKDTVVNFLKEMFPTQK